MSKKFLLAASFFIAAAYLLGCAGFSPKIERGVREGNIFYCTQSPNIKIKVNPDFKYMGEYDHTVSQTSSMGDFAGNIKYEPYIFMDNDKRLERGVFITFYTTLQEDSFYYSPQGGDKVRMCGKEYRCYIFPTKRLLGEREKQFAESYEIEFGKIYMVKRFVRKVRNDMLMIIFYVERYEDEEYFNIFYDLANPDRKSSEQVKFAKKHGYCKEYLDLFHHKLSDEQKEFQRQFLERSEKAYEVLGSI